MKYHFSSALIASGLLLLTGCTEDDDAAPQPHWQLSEQYIFDTMTLSNSVLNDGIASGQFMSYRRDNLPDDVYVRYAKMAAKMGLKKTPAIYLDTSDTRSIPQSAARFTREGTPYILINRSALTLWNNRELIAVLGHELVHLKEKHVTPAHLAEAYNTPGLSASHELEADRIGAGPLGSCDPQGLEEALEAIRTAEQRAMPDGIVETQGVPSDLTAADHPSWQIRKAALDAIILEPPEGCF